MARDRNRSAAEVDETTSEEVALSDQTEAAPSAAETTTEGGDAKETKAKKAPVPEGFTTPVQVAKKLSEVAGREIRPQIVYGYIRNSKTFPVHQHPEDGRPIVREEEVLAWWNEKEGRKAEREAKKASAATEQPAEASAAAEG